MSIKSKQEEEVPIPAKSPTKDLEEEKINIEEEKLKGKKIELPSLQKFKLKLNMDKKREIISSIESNKIGSLHSRNTPIIRSNKIEVIPISYYHRRIETEIDT
mmetsp:Transcript_25874/g.25149  ORF Transcript_25874/g.25149 Transcript_25874/m.25149 type:complete len:103 (+) Transcript_25874:330-638(+)